LYHQRTARQALISRIAGVWKSIAPSQPFSFSWLDEDLERSNSQRATISLMGYLAFMVVAIATLGLLGLVTYTVEVKRKEISIRKVIGADKRQLVILLSRGFIKVLFIAGFIATPIGYAAGFLFRRNFVNQVSFGPLNAIACFLLLLLIGLATTR
jgi:putative ABC transport system permease protein